MIPLGPDPFDIERSAIDRMAMAYYLLIDHQQDEDTLRTALSQLYDAILSNGYYADTKEFRRRIPTLETAVNALFALNPPVPDIANFKDDLLTEYANSNDPQKWVLASRLLFIRREYHKCALLLSKINDLTSLKLLGETYDIRPGINWRPDKYLQKTQSNTIHAEQVQCMLVMKRMGVARGIALIMCTYISAQK